MFGPVDGILSVDDLGGASVLFVIRHGDLMFDQSVLLEWKSE